MSQPQIEYRCPKCGMQRVSFDACVKWDKKAQRWEVVAVSYCESECFFCGAQRLGANRVEVFDDKVFASERIR